MRIRAPRTLLALLAAVAIVASACSNDDPVDVVTDDVPTTEAIKKLSRTAKGVMAPQCGLAPGFICIVAQ